MCEQLARTNAGDGQPDADAGLAGLFELITRRLAESQLGTRVLQRFVESPDEPSGQEELTAAVADEAAGDPAFAEAIARALGKPAGPVHATVAAPVGGIGNVVGGQLDNSGGVVATGSARVDQSRRSFRIGTGGIAAIVIAAVLGVGGVTAVVTDMGKAQFAEVAGGWIIGGESGTARLTVGGDGRWTVQAFVAGTGSGECSGTIERKEESTFLLKVQTGPCPDVTVTLADGGNTLVMTYPGDEQPGRWRKA